MSFTIDVNASLRSIEKVNNQLNRLPKEVIPAVIMAAGNYLLNQLITKEIPPEKRVTRKSVYGQSFQSAKQRRWFFWALGHGMIDVPYRRRGKHGGIGTQWHIIAAKDSKTLTLVNDDPAAQYVYGDDTQNRLIAAIGWKTISQITNEKAKNFGPVLKRAADKAIKDSLKK